MCGAVAAAKLGPMHVYRSALLRFADDGSALYDEDGLLVAHRGAATSVLVTGNTVTLVCSLN